MWFDWDPSKAGENYKKHGVSFEMAKTVFDDPMHLSVPEGKTVHEERWVTIGVAADAKTLLVVHSYFSGGGSRELIRLISARRATKKERRQYEEGV
jgi:uncharacterized DUF497 family protein